MWALGIYILVAIFGGPLWPLYCVRDHDLLSLLLLAFWIWSFFW